MIVVTGATGNVGRPLVSLLRSAGAEVTGVSRRPGDGTIQGSLTDPDGLRPALDGATALFVLIPADGAGVDPDAVLDAAKVGGVPRVVLLSSQGVRTRPSSVAHAGLRAFESALRGSGLEWTVLRAGGFASNALGWSASVRSEGVVAAPFGEVGLPVVDPADIAAVAAAALLDEGHAGRAYELTGPALVSPRRQAAAISAALGAPVRFAELSRAAARAQLLAFMPEPVVDGTLDILGAPTPDEQRISPDVPRILGRPASTFADWVTRNVAAFR